MVACITLCNSACITCIWCFLLSICFPKLVKTMEETESSECCARKCQSRRNSFESFGNHEVERQNGDARFYDLVREEENKTMGHRYHDPVNVPHRKSHDVEFLAHDESSVHHQSNSLHDINNQRLNENIRIGCEKRLYKALNRSLKSEKKSDRNDRPIQKDYRQKPKICYGCINER